MLGILPGAWAQPAQEQDVPDNSPEERYQDMLNTSQEYPLLAIPQSVYDIPLQSSVDYSSGLPPVKDQGKQQSCSAWATHYYAKTWYEGRKHPEWDLSDPRYQFSPAFSYNQVVIGQDEGSSLEQNLFILESRGAVDLAEMPYDEDDYTTQPTDSQFEAAKPYRITRDWGQLWHLKDPAPRPIDDVKYWLNGGNLVVMTIPIYYDFPDTQGSPTSRYYDYDGTSAFYEGHSVCICGYDDNANPSGPDPDHRGGFLMVNSRGADWNGTNKGFVYLSYDFVKYHSWVAWGMTDTPSDVPVINEVLPARGRPGDTVAIIGDNFGTDRRSSRVVFQGGAEGEAVSWNNERIEVKVPAGAEGGDIHVDNWYGRRSKGLPFDVIKPTWYLAEGTTAWGFNTYITIENPGDEDLNALITYMPAGAVEQQETVGLPASSQTTLSDDHLRGLLGEVDFSTRVECVEGRTIAVDRTMYWGDGSGDGHCSIGATTPAATWYLAEGSSAWGFECWLLLQNPNDHEATCNLTYMVQGEGPQTFEKKVAANSRATFNMQSDIGQKDASIKVDSDLPVIAERAMYRYGKSEGHDSVGTTSPAATWYLAEGCTSWGFTTYLLVQNPQDSETVVDITYMTPTGEVPHPDSPFIMPPNSRLTINVNDALPQSDFSTRVTGSDPIVAERAMYWGDGGAGGGACHDSIGVSSPYTSFYLPDGQSSDGRETWILVQNPNDSDVVIELTYLTSQAQRSVFVEILPPGSRWTFNMADKVPEGRAAVMVESRSEGKKIVAERAMYWNSRGAGTCTIGGY
jgi:hypothetical protein